ncbi:Bax inhibitor-1/YccA family protein [Clostridium perfringens]|nr:Bax inhibitor-1/YccA family protein [Clostridium perfringens]
MVLSFFGITLPIYGSGIIGIGFSLFVVAIATASLIMDYDFILKASQYGYPKYMEWYGAFGLMVTLIWLYTEILNLLAKFSDN